MNPFYGPQILIFDKNHQKQPLIKLAEALDINPDYLLNLPSLHETDLIAVNIRDICLVFELDEEETLSKISETFPGALSFGQERRSVSNEFELMERKHIEDHERTARLLREQGQLPNERKHRNKREHFKSHRR